MTHGPRWEVEPVPHVPSGDDPEEELLVELRMAREQLAQMEMMENPRGPPRLSGDLVAHPRLRGLSQEQVERHIRLLVADVVACRLGWTFDVREGDDGDEGVDGE